MELTPDVIAQYGIVTDNPFSCGNCGGFYPFKEVRLTLNTAPFFEATCLDCLEWNNLPHTEWHK